VVNHWHANIFHNFGHAKGNCQSFYREVVSESKLPLDGCNKIMGNGYHELCGNYAYVQGK
jgi:hypothetical protein